MLHKDITEALQPNRPERPRKNLSFPMGQAKWKDAKEKFGKLVAASGLEPLTYGL